MPLAETMPRFWPGLRWNRAVTSDEGDGVAVGCGAAKRLPAVRVRRPGVNQPKQLREPAISPSSNPSGGTQEQVFPPSGRASQPPGWPPSKSHVAAAPRGPGIISGLTTSRGRQGMIIPASASQETAPGSLMGPSPTSEPVPVRRHKMAQLGSIHCPFLRLGRAAPEPMGL